MSGEPRIIAISVDEDGCIRQVDNSTGPKVTSVKYGDRSYSIDAAGTPTENTP